MDQRGNPIAANQEHKVDIILFTYGSMLPHAPAVGSGLGEGQRQGQAQREGEGLGQGQGEAEGQGQGQGHEAGEGQGQGQGEKRGKGQGHGAGEEHGHGHGVVEEHEAREGQGEGEGEKTQSQGHGQGRGQEHGHGEGDGARKGQGQEERQGRAQGYGATEEQGQGPGQGLGAIEEQGQGRGQGLGATEEQGQGQGPGQGLGATEEQGQGQGYREGHGQADKPYTNLVDSRDERYFNICVPLYEASLTGDWDAAYAILGPNREYVTYAIDMDYNTPLHIAAYAQETKQTKDFVDKLLNLMTSEQLKIKNRLDSTAVCLAAASGNVGMVTSMVERNREVANILGNDNRPPLYRSARQGRYEALRYLYERYPGLDDDGDVYWKGNDKNKFWLLKECIEFDFFDLALQIVTNHPQLAGNGSVLGIMARKPEAFRRDCTHSSDNDDDAWRLLKIIWRDNIMRKTTDEVRKILRGPEGKLICVDPIMGPVYKYPSRILFDATKMGNTFFVMELIRAYPTLIWFRNDDGQTIFHVAAMHRHLGIFNILYEVGTRKNGIITKKDLNGNTMLHLIGMTSKKMRDETSGASLLMQRELLWFKEVEKMVLTSYRESKNNNGETAYEIFFKQNKDVISQGVKWMRDCMVVATLIVTIAFAVAFTIPGGYNQEVGIPIFVRKPSFLVFVIADAISLSCASTSLLMFLSLLTSRHGQRDFIDSLPKKLMTGLITLFISVAAMMVTFSASFFLLYNKELKWVPITIALLSSIPVLTFSIFQFRFLQDMISSVFCSRYLFNPRKPMLYKKKLSRFESIRHFFF